MLRVRLLLVRLYRLVSHLPSRAFAFTCNRATAELATIKSDSNKLHTFNPIITAHRSHTTPHS